MKNSYGKPGYLKIGKIEDLTKSWEPKKISDVPKGEPMDGEPEPS